MKRFVRLFSTILILFSAFTILVSASDEQFFMFLPEYYERVSEYEWYTDEFMINDEASTVKITAAIDESSLSYDQVFSDEFLLDFKASIEKTEANMEFIDFPQIKTTNTQYKYIYVSYVSEKNGVKSGVAVCSFYSEEQCCTLRFEGSSPIYVISGEPIYIVDKITFENDFFTEQTIPSINLNETEIIQNEEYSTKQPSRNENSEGFMMKLGLIIILLGVCWGGAAALKKRKIKVSGDCSVENNDFEMIIENVFDIKNHGVVVTGIIKSGVIHLNDEVIINNEKYTVTQIDVIPNQVTQAQKGMDAGLHLDTVNAALFKRGDIVSAKCFADSEEPEPKVEITDAPNVDKKRTEFNLGTFTFTEEERRKLRVTARQYMPDGLETPEDQLFLLEMLDFVMEITVIKLMIDKCWEIPEEMPDESKKNRFASALIETILTVDQSLGRFNTEFLIKKVNSATNEELLKSWIVLDYYTHLLKPEHTVDIQHFRDYIHSVIKTRYIENRNKEMTPPVRFNETNIYIDSAAFYQWKESNVSSSQFVLCGVLPLTTKEPIITLHEDGVKTREYRLQTEGDEDFTGKFFQISVRLGIHGSPAVPVAQIDGFVSDTPEERKMTGNDIGYRMEGHFLACGGEEGKLRYEMNRGQDLPMKALKYHGYTTPSSVRLVGICPDCGRSFCFHGYAFYMMQNDVAYSDDGLDCCVIREYDIDKNTWSCEYDGKTFRYYNSFNCPHCDTPYIDYKKYPQNKVFGVSGCVHLGRKPYYQEDI